MVDAGVDESPYSVAWIRAQTREFITVTEAARALRIDRKTIIRAIHSGEILAHRVGRQYLIDRHEFLAKFDR
jgi:excisionase family DNA binding protein